jgi:hypothetical protein
MSRVLRGLDPGTPPKPARVTPGPAPQRPRTSPAGDAAADPSVPLLDYLFGSDG